MDIIESDNTEAPEDGLIGYWICIDCGIKFKPIATLEPAGKELCPRCRKPCGRLTASEDGEIIRYG